MRNWRESRILYAVFIAAIVVISFKVGYEVGLDKYTSHDTVEVFPHCEEDEAWGWINYPPQTVSDIKCVPQGDL